MFIPRLTADQKTKAKGVKAAANMVIKAINRALKEKRLLITGTPMILTVEGQSIILDYEKLRKFDRSLDPARWHKTVLLKEILGKTALVISYKKDEINKGYVELYQLPEYQTELLGGLPVVEIG